MNPFTRGRRPGDQPEGTLIGPHLRQRHLDSRFVLALLSPINVQPRMHDVFMANCRTLVFEDIEAASKAVMIVLRRRQFGEAQDIMRSTGYDLGHPVTLGAAVGDNDLLVAIEYPAITDPGQLSSWQKRQLYRMQDPPKEPIIFYGSKAQLSMEPGGENSPYLDYKQASQVAESLFYMAQIASIG